MNRVFVDTSAVIALLVATDEFHQAANSAFTGLAARETPLLTTSYVLVETYALLGRRLGMTRCVDFESISRRCLRWSG